MISIIDKVFAFVFGYYKPNFRERVILKRRLLNLFVAGDKIYSNSGIVNDFILNRFSIRIEGLEYTIPLWGIKKIKNDKNIDIHVGAKVLMKGHNKPQKVVKIIDKDRFITGILVGSIERNFTKSKEDVMEIVETKFGNKVYA